MVTLEVVKFFQAIFISWDYRIYDIEKDMPTKVQSSNLNEELGQVHYIFSDKTGTLTCNIMEFKKFSAGLFSYGESGGSKEHKDRNYGDETITNVNFRDKTYDEHVSKKHENLKLIERVLELLALCHTVLIELKHGKRILNASSPDELALVNAAHYLDFEFVERDEEQVITLKVKG